MDKLTRDALFTIALQLELIDLLALCESSDRINKLVCMRDNIWLAKLKQEIPNYLDYKLEKSPRETYEFLSPLKTLKEQLKLEGSLLDIYNLKTLNLERKGLTNLPPEIGNLINLQRLYLIHNQLTTLPPEIGNLINLSHLYLVRNRLESIPPEIGNLINLRTLALYGNQLTTIPSEIGNLINLHDLYLGNNPLTIIPPEIKNNPRLIIHQ